MSQLALNTQPQYTLTALSGPEKGAVFRILTNRVTIGRSAQNDISIKDDTRMSRNHAVITIRGQNIEIKDVSDHNKVLVNGEQITSTEISVGSIFQLGDSKFQLSIQPQSGPEKALSPATSTSLNLDKTAIATQGHPPHMQQVHVQTPPRQRPRPPSNAQVDKGRRNFYILLGIIILFFTWVLTSQVKKKISTEIRTEDSIQAEIDKNRKTVEQAEEDRRKSGVDTKQYEEAQPNFVKGFRDYRKGQYERAIESFQACLSLFPSHIQCQRYLRMSQKKFSELVQYHMILANKYRSQNQFSACMASYRNVMVMLKNPSDKTYLEAKGGFEVCKSLEGDRY